MRHTNVRKKIAEYIMKTIGCTLTSEEEIYLTIHIERVTSRRSISD
ncbi:Transcription antiterminator, BglG family protein [Geobacillus sp. WSUCF1]|nr:Transcription antiterminator, BglG family protein [Geobacillus sp. WSUCF1]